MTPITPFLRRLAGCAAATTLAALSASAQNTLSGWAVLDANTFAPGPTSGQFAGSGAFGNSLPLTDAQPVQGFSAVLPGPVAGTYHVMADNGFGTKPNSPDALLRVYGLRPDFKTATGGTGTVSAVDYTTGSTLPSFTSSSYITLRDPDHKLGFALVADGTNYPGTSTVAGSPTIAVDPTIKSGRLLTGGDLDIESFRRDAQGNLWFGDEFGPFLVKTDATGKVLRSEIPLPGVQSPQNPYLGGTTPNLGGSRGFEGMALNASGNKLYTLLEGTMTGDPAGSLRINEFDLATEAYTGAQVLYKLESEGTAIGDMSAIFDNRFLVIERNGGTGTSGTPFKKVFMVDIDQFDDHGFARKTELVDLMNIADPFDLNGDGSTVFTFPFVTIEDILLLDSNTLLIMNDNNYPGGGGRGAFSDQNEFLLITIATPIPEPSTYAMLVGLAAAGAVAFRRWSARR